MTGGRAEATIIHLHIHRPTRGSRKDYYFATLRDVFRLVDYMDICVSPQALANYRFNKKRFYANHFCTMAKITLNDYGNDTDNQDIQRD